MGTVILLGSGLLLVGLFVFLMRKVRKGYMGTGDVVSLMFIALVALAAILTNTEAVFGIPNVL